MKTTANASIDHSLPASIDDKKSFSKGLSEKFKISQKNERNGVAVAAAGSKWRSERMESPASLCVAVSMPSSRRITRLTLISKEPREGKSCLKDELAEHTVCLPSLSSRSRFKTFVGCVFIPVDEWLVLFKIRKANVLNC